MTFRSRSPLKLACEYNRFLREKLCVWVCLDDTALGTARFIHRKRSDVELILHRSTKGYAWQLSTFEHGAPIGDVQGSSCSRALRNGEVNRDFKLVEIQRRT